jgi:hypothetical protein
VILSETISLILGKTSGKQLDKSSKITHFNDVFSKIYTIVCDPIKPNPPGKSKVLKSVIFKASYLLLSFY